jgi:uncharacterized repeat protein (TIGR02543 family)
VTSIGNFAFAWVSSVDTITIPASVTSIGIGVFYHATSLSNINVESNNFNYRSSDGVLFNKPMTTLICYPSGKTDISYVIPSAVTTIHNSAFANASALTSVTIPAGVTNLEAYAFQNASSLTSITLPTNLASLDFYSFNGATSLSSVYFLGDAPLGAADAFVGVASGAKAYIKHEATGFAEHGATWNGLVIERAAEEIRYIVSYNSIGGTSVDSDSVTADGLIQEAPVSNRTGHTLLGWSTSEDGSLIDFPFDPEVNSDVTLYAIWSLNTYEISFNSQGGTAVASRTLSYGQQLSSAPTSPTRSGYVFAGWSTTPTGSVISFPFTSSGYVDKTLHAKWNKKASVTASKPTVSGKAASTKAGSNKLTVKPGVWTGIPTPKLTYQWYLCTTQVKVMTSTIPKSCKAIAKQTKTSLAVVTSYKGKYLAVKVTGTSAGTTPTTYLTASSAKVS